MIYVSAGHHNLDSGAISSNCGRIFKEADLTKIQRDLTIKQLDVLNVKYIVDKDTETLSEYLKRISPTSSDVVIEFHFNSFNKIANGVETIVGNKASKLSLDFAKEINDATVQTLQLKDRGVKYESESARGKLGLFREAGISCLVEICFIDNCLDMDSWLKNKEKLAIQYARIISKYENLAK